MKENTAVAEQEQKAGTGVDRTLIRRLLEMTPAERVQMMVVEARNVEAFLEKIRR